MQGTLISLNVAATGGVPKLPIHEARITVNGVVGDLQRNKQAGMGEQAGRFRLVTLNQCACTHLTWPHVSHDPQGPGWSLAVLSKDRDGARRKENTARPRLESDGPHICFSTYDLSPSLEEPLQAARRRAGAAADTQ